VEGSITTNIAPWVVSTAVKGIFLYCVLPISLLIAIMIILGVWLGRASKRRTEIPQAPPAPVVSEDAQGKLQKLKAMLDEGLISEADYEAKKTDILSKM
jgi:hypothetical protein